MVWRRRRRRPQISFVWLFFVFFFFFSILLVAMAAAAATLLAGMASNPFSPLLSSPLRLPPSSPSLSRQCLRIQAAKTIQGKVVCASNDKTVSVLVSHLVVFKKYRKRVKRSRNYHAHDPDNKCKVGDVVTLEKCAPVSKTKSFVVVEAKQGRIQDGLLLPSGPI